MSNVAQIFKHLFQSNQM